MYFVGDYVRTRLVIVLPEKIVILVLLLSKIKKNLFST